MVNTKHIPKSVVPAGFHAASSSISLILRWKKISRKSRFSFPIAIIALDPVAQYHHLKHGGFWKWWYPKDGDIGQFYVMDTNIVPENVVPQSGFVMENPMIS